MADNVMVERVARAIWALQRDTDCNDYSQLTKSTKALADDMARAAIGAMREPTEEMARNEAHESTFPPDTEESIKQSWRDEYAKIWTAMIDAALTPTKDR